MLACLCGLVFLVWNSFVRYEALGTITGRVIDVPPAWAGMIDAIHVNVGDVVERGQTIATLNNPTISDEFARMADDLRVARAELDAEVSRVSIELRREQDRRQEASADYHQLAGELAAETSAMEDLTSRLVRARKLAAEDAIGRQDFQTLQFQEAGARARVKRLERAVAELEKRAFADARDEHGERRLKPNRARIAQLEAELSRLNNRLQLGTLTAPVAGRVMAVPHDAGEYVEPSQSVITIVERGSLELMLFVRQADSCEFVIGDAVTARIEPYSQPINCRVDRIGQHFRPAPKCIETHFRHGEQLMPVYLSPVGSPSDVALRIGGVVRVPRQWSQSQSQER